MKVGKLRFTCDLYFPTQVASRYQTSRWGYQVGFDVTKFPFPEIGCKGGGIDILYCKRAPPQRSYRKKRSGNDTYRPQPQRLNSDRHAHAAPLQAESVVILPKVIIQRAEQDIDYIMPSDMHLQGTQRIRWNHWLLSYATAFQSDLVRRFAKKNINKLSLGSGAFYGNAFGIDRM